MIKEVLLIFKTHLDIGYTDLAENVIKHYKERFLPSAIQLAYRQKDTDCPFIWTTGSWLIYEALRTDDGTLEQAIRDGLIQWHALPFTTHTELMNGELLDYGLSLSKQLDERFGRHTIAAKMTDVPGHTIGLVPHLARAGVKLLHIGVNPATVSPDVPEIFRWRCGNDSLTVMYNKGYGDFCEVGETAIGFGVTNDNSGPHTPQELEDYYRLARGKYPNARVYAATLNDIVGKLDWETLPEVRHEIGDTWIYGAGSDPKKISGYRALLRHAEGRLAAYDLTDNLLLVPEHTWGCSAMGKFPDTTHYLCKEFAAYCTSERAFMEQAWEEQREYVRIAAKKMAFDIDKETEVLRPSMDNGEPIDCSCAIELSYQLFDASDYERYANTYFDGSLNWAIWDYTKQNLPTYQSGIFTAKVEKAVQYGTKKIYELKFDKGVTELCGLPVLYITIEDGQVEVSWFDKKPNRLPEAFWLKFKGYDENWQIHKLDQWMEPPARTDSPLLHGVWRGIRNETVEIESLDAPLVAPFGRHLLEYGIAHDTKDLYFNLYNNVWNTNFPLWYSDDAKFRFHIYEK